MSHLKGEEQPDMAHNPNPVPRDEEYLPYPAVAPILESLTFGFFMVEMLVKMVALGVFGCQGSYLSNNWNKFDAFINTVSVVDYFLSVLGINWQISKPLEPMRLLGRIPSMRALMKVLLDMTPMLINVFILYIFIINIFAVVGVQLWAGQLRNRCFLGEDILGKYNVSMSPFYEPEDGERYPFICSPDGKHGVRRCSDVPPYTQDGELCSVAAPDSASAANPSSLMVGDVRTEECTNWHMYYNVCRTGNHNPHRGAVNFDHIGYAWLTTFQMGSFVMMNVCAVVIVNQFTESIQRAKGQRGAGAASIAWLRYMLTSCLRVISSIYNSRRRNTVHCNDSGSMEGSLMVHIWQPIKRRLKCIVDSKLFNQGIMFAIFFSVVTMAIEHHGQPKELTRMLKVTNIVFIIIFIAEMAMKLLVLSGAYFWDPSNVFDFVIVISSVWEVIAKVDSRLSVLRAFRLLRFVRLVKFLPHLKRQLLVLKRTIQEAAALCGLLLIATVLGMQLFGNKFSFQTKNGVTVTDRKNFDTIRWSMVTVFQILTLEDWNLVLYNAMSATSHWAALYFVGLIVLGKYILLNILMGIVVESFQEKGPRSPLPSCPNLTHSSPSEADSNEENVLAHGLVFGKETYLRSPWNVVDGFLVALSLVDVLVSLVSRGKNKKLGILKVLRLLRTLRPLRVIKRAPKLKLAVDALIASVKPIGNIALICCAFFLFFGILGVQLFKGKFFYCVGQDTRNVTSKSDCLSANYQWVRKTYHFDNLPQALLSLFVMFSKDSWVNIMYDGLDAVGVDKQPVQNHNEWMLLFFISLMIISFVLLDMFIGVMVDTFHQCQQEQKMKDELLGEDKTQVEHGVLKAKKLRLLLRTIIKTLSQVENICLLFTFFFFIYAVLGVELFGRLSCSDDNPCHGLHRNTNFRHFGMALLTLYQVCTGDNWSGIMRDTLRSCRPGDVGCLSYLHWVSPIFFTSFVVMGQFVLVNLVVAAIMQALEDSSEVRQNAQTKKAHRHTASLWLEQLVILFDHVVLIAGKTHFKL
ncbi:Voltage-dependent T-type calcium channel subunit alpha-1H [Nibea albiflora]|uniref:Voltage-dependent T-type calcium channel subunit alpha-1H n=1 Tax=Nibea albiflora TaxID=240163 RepID=A0ACB7FGT9_NIBAL|nr:Voltage-dependent T-type calcium channel subunit alpha-1H [Nibea albiflora]